MIDVAKVVVIIKPRKAVPKDAAVLGWGLPSATTAVPGFISEFIAALMVFLSLAPTTTFTGREFPTPIEQDVC